MLLEFLKLLRVFFSSFRYHVNEVMREHEGLVLSLEAKLLLEVAEDVPEINMKQLPVLHNHDVVRVSVRNTCKKKKSSIDHKKKGQIGSCWDQLERFQLFSTSQNTISSFPHLARKLRRSSRHRRGWTQTQPCQDSLQRNFCQQAILKKEIHFKI